MRPDLIDCLHFGRHLTVGWRGDNLPRANAGKSNNNHHLRISDEQGGQAAARRTAECRRGDMIGEVVSSDGKLSCTSKRPPRSEDAEKTCGAEAEEAQAGAASQEAGAERACTGLGCPHD